MKITNEQFELKRRKTLMAIAEKLCGVELDIVDDYNFDEVIDKIFRKNGYLFTGKYSFEIKKNHITFYFDYDYAEGIDLTDIKKQGFIVRKIGKPNDN